MFPSGRVSPEAPSGVKSRLREAYLLDRAADHHVAGLLLDLDVLHGDPAERRQRDGAEGARAERDDARQAERADRLELRVRQLVRAVDVLVEDVDIDLGGPDVDPQAAARGIDHL